VRGDKNTSSVLRNPARGGCHTRQGGRPAAHQVRKILRKTTPDPRADARAPINIRGGINKEQWVSRRTHEVRQVRRDLTIEPETLASLGEKGESALKQKKGWKKIEIGWTLKEGLRGINLVACAPTKKSRMVRCPCNKRADRRGPPHDRGERESGSGRMSDGGSVRS